MNEATYLQIPDTEGKVFTRPTGKLGWNAYFGVLHGEAGVRAIKDLLAEDPQSYIGFGDCTKIAAMNAVYHREIVDILLAAIIGAINGVAQKYGGLAVNLSGDEVGVLIPGHTTDAEGIRTARMEAEVERIRREAEFAASMLIPGQFGFAQLEGGKIEEREDLNAVLRENSRSLLTGVYEDDDGIFLVFHREWNTLEQEVERLESKLRARSLSGRITNPMKLYNPEVTFGFARASGG